jgi:hypothetical protein
MWPLFLLRAKGKRKEMTGTQHVGTLKHKFLQYITIKNVLVLFHYQNNFEMNSSSAIWWRHLPVACSNFFEAGVSGNCQESRLVFHSRDFRSPISRDPDDCFIPAFPGNWPGIPGNRIDTVFLFFFGNLGIIHQMLRICLKIHN